MHETVTDAQRFPLLTDHGRELLLRLREHPNAPKYSAQSGNRLTADGLRRVHDFDRELKSARVGWDPEREPDWMDNFIEMCFRDVPFYRRYGTRPARFDEVPIMDRSDLSRDACAFVPDPLPVDEIIIYSTSGTTGHPVVLPSHPVVAGCYLSLVKRALQKVSIELTSHRGQVACILIGYQQSCFTYASVNPLVDDAGFIKINLHPADWRDPDDRVRFIDECNPEIITGDPISFAELGKLPLKARPRALVSTSMTLLNGLRKTLGDRFECPVLDIYSTNESGPIGLAVKGGYELLQHRLYIEILDPNGSRCPVGARGEITLTGGFNPYLPLLRYRTGDQAALMFQDGRPALIGLEGRPPVRFRTMAGDLINNIDVTHALKQFAISQFTLHQAADGSLHLRMRGSFVDGQQVKTALSILFGANQPITIENDASFDDKIIQYTTEIT